MLSGQIDVAVIAGTYIFGDWGGRIVGALICIGLVSSINAMMWIGPRVTVAMGEDFPLLRIFSRKSRNNVPSVAVLFQAVVASMLLGTQTFEAVLDFIQFSLISVHFGGGGRHRLRFTHPQLPALPGVGIPVTTRLCRWLHDVLFVTNRPKQFSPAL
jgi:APA family basic amino acid/polyamine antiporter